MQRGGDVLLQVKNPVKLEMQDWFTWIRKGSQGIVYVWDGIILIFPHFEERVEISSEDRSLLLKNLTHADSGVYTARVDEMGSTRVVAEYTIQVQGGILKHFL